MAIRGIRGATTVSLDTPEEITGAVTELLTDMIAANSVDITEISSIFFTATPDLRSIFPAQAARNMGLESVPLMCAQEIDVAGGLPMTLRILMTINSELSQKAIAHRYLRGARALRPDLTE